MVLRRSSGAAGLVGVLSIALAVCARAQDPTPAPTVIETDGSVGEAVALEAPYEIPARLGSYASGPGSANLFHSFRVFDVGARGATFTREGLPPGAPVDHLIARVTGGESHIDGTLRSEVGEAHLLLVNPAGIVFGPGSRLDVPGSFHASTAHQVEHRGGGIFSAIEAERPLLRWEPPQAFGFTSARPLDPGGGGPVDRRIEVRGFLEVGVQERLSLVGGDLLLEGSRASDQPLGVVSSVDGDVVLIAVDSPGSVSGLFDHAGDAPELILEGFAERADIAIERDAVVSSSGLSSVFRPQAPGFLAPPYQLDAIFRRVDGSLQRIAGRVSNPPEVFARDVFRGEDSSGVRHYLRPDNLLPPDPDLVPLAATGAGDVLVRARNLDITDAEVRSNTVGDGDAGAIDVQLTGVLTITGEDREVAGLVANAGGAEITGDLPRNFSGLAYEELTLVLGGSGAGGDIRVHARDVRLSGGGRIDATTLASGRGGSVTVSAPDGVIEVVGRGARDESSAILSNAFGTADAGDVAVEARLLRLSEGGSIFTQTAGDADAGDIRVDVARLEILSDSQIDSSTSAQSLDRDAAGSTNGNAGAISVEARESILISGSGGGGDPARISTLSQARSRGRAGSVTVRTPRLDLVEGGGVTVAARGDGDAGIIRIEVDELRLRDGGRVEGESTGTGLGGRIEVAGYRTDDASSIEIVDGSRMTAAAPRSDGGSIDLRARDRIDLRSSLISASVGAGTGGNVTIDPRRMIVDRSAILARAETGRGGNVEITAGQFFLSGESVVSASSRTGVDGTVLIHSPEVDLSGSLTGLPDVFLGADRLLRDRCAARDAGARSTFAVETDGVLPDHPDRVRQSLYVAHADALEAARRGRLDEALRLLDGRVAAADAHADPSRAALAHASRAQVRARAGLHAAARDDRSVARRLAPSLSPALALDAAAADLEAGDLRRARERWADLAGRVGAEAALASLELARLEGPGPSDPERLALLDRAERGLRDAPKTGGGLRFARIGLARALGVESQRRRDPRLRLRAARLLAEIAADAEASADAWSAAWAWISLGELYLADRRASEALVLARRGLAAAREAGAPATVHAARWLLGRAHLAGGETDAALRALRAATGEVMALRSGALLAGARPATVEQALATHRVALDLVDALLRRSALEEREHRLQALLLEVLTWIEELRAASVEDYFADPCISAQRRASPQQVTGALAIYPVALRDRLELVVGTASGLETIRVDVTLDQLDRAVEEMQQLLSDPTTQLYRRPAGRLYEWLVRPLEQRLAQERPEVVVWVPGGALRSLAFSALWDADARQHLVEQTAIAVTPATTLLEPRPFTVGGITLKGGLSVSVRGLPALAAVESEIARVDSLFGGPVLLNEDFTSGALIGALGSRPFDVVHLASHAELGSSIDASYIVTYDGQLGLDELARRARASTLRERPLELLVLSACNTGLDTERAVLGLGGMAVRAGARSALASLWSVDDEASSLLMAEFYRHLGTGSHSRARALQEAQLSLARIPAFRHPYYWSAFLLIGSWL